MQVFDVKFNFPAKLADLALDMEPEDGLIWVYDPHHEGGTMAFTEYGIESLLRRHRTSSAL